MRPDEIRVGACYFGEWRGGTIRKVTAIRTIDGARYVDAVSHRLDDPPDTWPGSNGAYMEVFAANSLYEVPVTDVKQSAEQVV